MEENMGRAKAPHCSVRTLWGLAKSKELCMEEEDLYALVYAETGKESIRKLSQGELDRVCRILKNRKDSVRSAALKPTNKGGNRSTQAQRGKIFALTEKLGWNDDNRRINGFVKRMFGIDRIEWLDEAQCGKLIEILKKYVKREERD